jgi:uncharacterized OB-fold protein
MSPRALGEKWGLPILDDKTREFFSAGRLRVQACKTCDAVQHPPEDVCRACGGHELGFVDAGETGTVHSCIVVHHAVTPALTDRIPYAVLLVVPDAAPGVRLVGNLVGSAADTVSIGDRVRAVFEAVTIEDPAANTGETLKIPQWELA